MPSVAFLATEMKKYDFSFPSLRLSVDATLRAASAVHKFVRNEFGQRSWPHWGKLHGCSLHKFVRNEFGQRSWPHRGKLLGCSLQIVYPDDLSFSGTDVLKNGSISIMLHSHIQFLEVVLP